MTFSDPNCRRKIVIMGAGQAGLSCAKALRIHGFTGSIVLLGDELHPPYDRPPLSKSVLSGDASVQSTYYLTATEIADQGIEFRPSHNITSIDRARNCVSTAHGESISYDHLVVATGARVRRLSLPGAETAGVHYLRDIEDCQNLSRAIRPGRRVLVVGGGLIGLEVAAAATKLGAQATVIEVADRVMARIVGPEISTHFEELHRKNGVEILTNTKPTQIRSESGSYIVDFDDGTDVKGDLIVAGIGVIPNDSIATAAGLRTGNGLWVNEFGCTDDLNISAAGDVANHFNPLLGRRVRLETWQNAKSQATAVARNLCGQVAPYAENPWGWSDQFGTNLQMLGMPENFEGGIMRGNVGDGSFSIFYMKDGNIDGMIAVNAVRDVAASRRLMADRIRVDTERLGDVTIPMKSLLGV